MSIKQAITFYERTLQNQFGIHLINQTMIMKQYGLQTLAVYLLNCFGQKANTESNTFDCYGHFEFK